MKLLGDWLRRNCPRIYSTCMYARAIFTMSSIIYIASNYMKLSAWYIGLLILLIVIQAMITPVGIISITMRCADSIDRADIVRKMLTRIQGMYIRFGHIDRYGENLLCAYVPNSIPHATDVLLRSDSTNNVVIDFRRYVLACSQTSICAVHHWKFPYDIPVLTNRRQKSLVYVHPGVGWPIHIVSLGNEYHYYINRSSAFRSCWFWNYHRNRAVFAARMIKFSRCYFEFRWSLFHRRIIRPVIIESWP